MSGQSESGERDVNPDERQLKHFTEPNKIRRAWTIEPNQQRTRDFSQKRFSYPIFHSERRKKPIKIRLEMHFLKPIFLSLSLKWVVVRLLEEKD
jgi:hypothetical protein